MPEAVQSVPFALKDIDKLANELLVESRGCKVWLFYGDLGAGKTTLIKSVCSALGVRSTMTSPTFSIVNEYVTDSGEMIYHFDCFRLKNEIEAYDIGAEEYLDSGNYCFIEWPDRIPALIPSTHFELKIQSNYPSHRTIEFHLHE